MLSRELAELALGSRLRALSDGLFDAVDAVYRAQGSPLSARGFLLLRCLLDGGPMSVGALSERLGQTHAAVSQSSRKLIEAGWIERRGDAGDQRRSLLALTAWGDTELRRLQPLWGSIQQGVRAAIESSGLPLLDAIAAFEAELERQPLAERILRCHAARREARVEIVPFAAALREHFYRLNAEWLTRHFAIEEVDHRVLSQPEDHILRPGGRILFALLDGEPVGTCALMPDSPGVYELTKMAVTARCQGLGIGRRLLQAAIGEFHRLGGGQLFLESHHSLQAALHLYAAEGFELQAGRRPGSHYRRSDVYMLYRPREAA